MTPSDQVRLLLRKALLALAGCDDPRSHNIALLLELLSNQGIPLPGEVEALEALTPFGTVFRYDDLPFEDAPDRYSWPPLIHRLFADVQALIDASGKGAPEIRS